MEGAEALYRSSPPPNRPVGLLNDVVEVFHPAQLAVSR